MSRFRFNRIGAALLAGVSLTVISTSAVVLTPTAAIAQSSEDFRVALESYGFWQRHPRFGDVWVPFDKPRTWRPYTVGRWVYTDEWGWYWVSEQDEEAWGWITFHYGRWINDRRLGWAWVPGDEWAPAWVNWRRSNDIVGWAPAVPEDVIYDYDDDPNYWTFVEPRYLTAPRVRTYFVPAPRVNVFIRQTVVVNRTFVSGGGRRFAVNPGVSPGFVAARAGRPLDTFRLRPRVLAGTDGVSGAVAIQASQNRIGDGRPDRDGRRGPPGQRQPAAAPNLPSLELQRSAAVQPSAQTTQTPPQPLGRERGRLGNNPPRAAQGGPGGAPAGAPSPAAPPATAPNSPPPPAPPPSAAPASPPPGAPNAPPPSSPPPAASDANPPAIAPQTPADRSRPFNPGARPPGAPAAAPTPSPAPAAPPAAAPPPPAAPATPPPAAAPPRPNADAPRPPEQRQERREERREQRQEQRPAQPAPQAAPPPRPAPPSPPPQARPEPPRPAAPPAPPPQARPAPPSPPPAAAPPTPPAARPAPPPPPAAPAPKPAEKPEEKK